MEDNIYINTEDIKNYFLENLYEAGFIPRDEELDVIADIAFDYMLETGIIIEEDDVE